MNTGTPAHERGPLISRHAEVCDGCSGCVRCCPVRAIRITGGRSEVIAEKCVACGLCVGECSRGGHTVRDDTAEVTALLRSRRPVVALLATEFVAALYPMSVMQVERALELLGFCSVETTALGEEIVAGAYERAHATCSTLLSIRSTCPVVVDFVRTYHPALVPALAPIVPPYVAQARLIRELYDTDVAIVYVSPCYARKDEALGAEFAGAVDVAIDFLELRRMLAASVERRSPAPAVGGPVRRPGVFKEASLTDGFPRQTVAQRHMSDSAVFTVRGLADLGALLRAIQAGEVAPEIIDALNCEGCIDGPAVAPGLSVYAKRTIDASVRRDLSATAVSTRALLAVLPTVELVRSFTPTPVSVPEPTPEQIDAELASARIERDTAPDCRACGWDTCVEQAAAVFRGDSTWDLCLPLQRSLLAEQAVHLEGSETLDALTGLPNRRVFGDRLDLERSRQARYGTDLVLMFVDIDALGAINDTHGEPVGDALLAEIGGRFARSLRATDLIARWSGDRFALLLPGISKTAAFAVGEKLRESLAGGPVPVEVAGYTHDVAVTVSIGVVACRSETADTAALLEAADTALREAIDSGGDQVRLAPG